MRRPAPPASNLRAGWSPRSAALCIQSVRGLTGQLDSAYAELRQLSPQGWLNTEKSWLYSELGEMAVRLGLDADAQRWFQQDLNLVPTDFYVRAAYADLLLRQGSCRRSPDAAARAGKFRAAVAAHCNRAKAIARPAPGAEQRPAQSRVCRRDTAREAVHRREQARFLLEVENQPQLSP
jgi:hypothetical protein